MRVKDLRSFEFREGTSDKFWTISLDRSSHSVRFGRNGTAGQEQTKTFSSEQAARASYEKLIAEKLKKGYGETGTARAFKPAEQKRADRNPPGLHLAPEDWLYATWRPREIQTRPEAPPFAVENGLKRLDRFITKTRYDRPWLEARMPVAMTSEEARFWLGAMLAIAVQERPHYWMTQFPDSKALLSQAAGTDLTRTPPIGEVIERLNGVSGVWLDLPEAVLLPLSALYSWSNVLELLAALNWRQQHHTLHHDQVFRIQVLPYLSEDQFVGLRETVRKVLNPAGRGDFREIISPLLGLHEEMRTYIQKRHNLDYIFGLGSAKEVRDAISSGNYHFQPEMVRAWFAHMELNDPGPLIEALLRMGKTDGRAVVKEFVSLVSAPSVAAEFLRLADDGKFLIEARDWFDAHPREAIEGLAGEMSGSGRKAATARSIVQGLKRKLGESPDDATETPAEATVAELPDGLAQAFATARRVKVKEPKWVSALDLPPIVLEGGRLSEKEVTFLLALLASTPAAPPHPLLVALRCYATPESLDTFADALFNRWREAGMNGKEKWGLLSLGALGSDRCALRIAPYVREWPGQSKHQAAAWGLECLRLIGTDTAIMQINQIAQKTKFQALKKAAQETMEGIAEDRDLTRDELEDRIVPDCGLDEHGSRVFDFGPRQFRLRIGSSLKPLLIDTDGNRRDDLPKPGAKDDAAQAQQAVSEWKLLKKQMSEVVKAQVARMEQALITQRRWTATDFRALLVQHPIVSALIRPLVWGVFDASNRPIASFRVAEDRTYADSRDDACEPDQDASIGVLHPAHMDDALKAQWGELLADYELIQPFPQLSRLLHRLNAQELSGKEIVRHTEARVKPIVFAGIAKRLGYTHGQVGDGGSYFTHAKWFPSAGITAVLQHSWLSIGYHETDLVNLEKAYFVPEKFGRGRWADEPRNKVPLREVDEMVISEILSDMAVLASRAEAQ